MRSLVGELDPASCFEGCVYCNKDPVQLHKQLEIILKKRKNI